MLSRLQLNVVANLAGRAGSVLVAVGCTPFYLRYLGVEAYGLIGVYLSLFVLASVLDFGLGTTLNRELARRAGGTEAGSDASSSRSLVALLSLVSSGLALAVAALVALGCGAIAHHWLRGETLDAGTMRDAILLMGIALALQWPIGLFSGGLSGLQRQVALNVVLLGASILRGIGAVLVLAYASPSIEAYFAWQVLVGVLHAATLRLLLGRMMPPARGPVRIDFGLLRSIGGFAAGVSGIAMLSVIASNLDRLLLSTWLPLDRFAHYTLAGFVASLSTFAVAPLFNALLPRFSELVARDDAVGISTLYHYGSQVIAVLTFPLAGIVVVFAPEILWLWTHDATIAAEASGPARALAIGATCLALANMPYAVQLAFGWTRLAVLLNGAALLLMPPLLYLGVTRGGATGAATAWALVNAAMLLVGMAAMHRRYLRGEILAWLLRDTLPAAAIAASVMLAARWVLSADAHAWTVAGILGAALAAAMALSALAAPATRGQLARWLPGARSHPTGPQA